jgi:hypothetical protein
LKFTAVLWKLNDTKLGNQKRLDNRILINTDICFPFLDMELSWNEKRELSFGVHLKLNQQLKYLNKGSAHTKDCFLAITNGVCKWVTKLTSIDESNENKRLDEVYPLHFQALLHADLLQGKHTPTFKSVLETMQKHNDCEEAKPGKRRETETV